MRLRWLFLSILFMSAAGCLQKPKPTPPPAPVPAPPHPVQGTWTAPNREGGVMQMVFEPAGRLTFQGGMEFYNPAQWDWNPQRKELTLTFPQASDNKLQIFKLSVGDGVKSFDRAGKQVIYQFDPETTSLNIAGWIYSKTTQAPQQNIIPEPTLK